MRFTTRFARHLFSIGLALPILAGYSHAQQVTSPPAVSGNPATVRITLQEAMDRARRNSVEFQSAATDAAIAREDRNQARDALLPSARYENSGIYTQGNGPGNPIRFIANNAVHEYISQGNLHESFDLAALADSRRAAALSTVARAKQEIALRGLVVTVVESYYGVLAAQQKLDAASRAADEGERFFQLTQNLEKGGEVAHADVIKAELQVNDRRRQLRESQLALLNARLDLAVLLFPDFNDKFELIGDLHANVPLPTLGEFQQQAGRKNPELQAALATVRAGDDEVAASRVAYLPSLSFDYFYGIDATHFATNTDGVPNLGSSAVATVTVPLWDWGATQSRVKQSELRRTQSRRELSRAQRQLLAETQSLYAEANTALDDLASLNRSAELATESLRLTNLRYKGGEATVLEVVDAQNSLLAADSAYQDGAVRYFTALAHLQTLTGELPIP
jgi:outer membrane protein TolC